MCNNSKSKLKAIFPIKPISRAVGIFECVVDNKFKQTNTYILKSTHGIRIPVCGEDYIKLLLNPPTQEDVDKLNVQVVERRCLSCGKLYIRKYEYKNGEWMTDMYCGECN